MRCEKAFSDIKPEALHKSMGKWWFNLNLKEEQNEEGEAQWVYDTVSIEGSPTRDKLIAAGMCVKYSKDDEIALINNKILGEKTSEWQAYINYRMSVKQQVGDAGFPKE